MCFEVAGIHHHIYSVKGCQVSAFLENVAEDLRPEGLPRLSICLICQGSVSLETCRRITNHKSWKGIEAFSPLPISWQGFIHDLFTPLCMGEPDGRWCDRSICREPHFILSHRSLIDFHGQGSAHGSISSGSSPESVGLRLTLCIPSSKREEAMVAYYKDPPPAEDYSVLSGRASVSKERRRLKPVPAEDYYVLSGDTRNNQEKATKSYNALLAPGAKMNEQQGHVDKVQILTQKASSETCHSHGISPLASHNTQ